MSELAIYRNEQHAIVRAMAVDAQYRASLPSGKNNTQAAMSKI